MPKDNDTVHIRFSMGGMSRPFWQTNAPVASVSGTSLLLDGLDRQVPAVASELKRAGEGRWTLDWEVRRRP
jgi:hypothetical protein